MHFFRTINSHVAAIVSQPGLNAGLTVAARALLASLFILSGYGKISGYAGAQGYMEVMGVPGALLPLVILLELGGGLALLAGFQTRLVALALAVFTLAAGFLFHGGADQMQQIMFLKNVSIAGGLLGFVVFGGGRASLDAETQA